MSEPSKPTLSTPASPIKDWCITLRFDATQAEAEAIMEKAYDLIAGSGSVGSLREEIGEAVSGN